MRFALTLEDCFGAVGNRAREEPRQPDCCFDSCSVRKVHHESSNIRGTRPTLSTVAQVLILRSLVDSKAWWGVWQIPWPRPIFPRLDVRQASEARRVEIGNSPSPSLSINISVVHSIFDVSCVRSQESLND